MWSCLQLMYIFAIITSSFSPFQVSILLCVCVCYLVVCVCYLVVCMCVCYLDVCMCVCVI